MAAVSSSPFCPHILYRGILSVFYSSRNGGSGSYRDGGRVERRDEGLPAGSGGVTYYSEKKRMKEEEEEEEEKEVSKMIANAATCNIEKKATTYVMKAKNEGEKKRKKKQRHGGRWAAKMGGVMAAALLMPLDGMVRNLNGSYLLDPPYTTGGSVVFTRLPGGKYVESREKNEEEKSRDDVVSMDGSVGDG
jgi:hypothetical protein